MTPARPEAFHAPLFREMVSGLGSDQRRVVLDLGAATTPMLALFGNAQCRVEIADLAHFGGIERLNATGSARAIERLADSLFPKRLSDDPLDLVLCWDLPNYLNLESLSALMKSVAVRARPGALAHALIHYADREMRQYPGCYVPTEDADLVDRGHDCARVPAPRYSPEALGEHIGYFVIDRARLLSNGMQEFLFELKP